MQRTIVMAFRKRLKKRGYSEVSIVKIKDSSSYKVKAIEPLAGVFVEVEYSEVEMSHAFHF